MKENDLEPDLSQPADEDEGRGEGVAPYRGYEFQIEATAYLALELMFGLRWTTFIDVEPLGGEDVATSIEQRRERPAWLSAAGPVPLFIQIKSNGSGHWTPAEFNKVMEGKERAPNAKQRKSTRVRPAEALRKNLAARFLFVTDAQVKVELAVFRLDDLRAADSKPDETTVVPESATNHERSAAEVPVENPPATPAVAGGAVDADLAPRVMIIDRHTRRLLRLLTERLLRDRLYVPTDEIPATIKDLCDEVRARLLEEKPTGRRWDRSQVSAVIEVHGGHPNFSANAPPVYPTNHGAMIERLATRSALLVAGPIGVGKTLLAEDLVGRAAQRGLDVKRPKTPSELRRLIDRGGSAKLFYIEDPWGKYKTRDGADLWQEELPRLITRASPVNQFIITSRTGILEEVYPLAIPAALGAVTVRVDESHYPEDLRLRILRQELVGLEAWRRDLLVNRERSVVRKLPVPLSLQCFASQLREVKPGASARVNLDALVKASNVDAIGNALANEISAGGDGQVSAAITLWLLLMMRRGVTEKDVSGIAGLLSAGGWTGPEPQARTLVDRLIASGAATWAGDGLQLHPTRLEGLELLTNKRKELSAAVVNAVLGGLLKRDGVAAVSTAARALRGRKLPLPPQVKAALTAFLVKQIGSEDESEGRAAFDDLTTLGADDEPVVVLARALGGEDAFDGNGFVSVWSPPVITEPQREAIAKSQDARLAAAVFIRQILPSDSGIGRYRWKDLDRFLSGFGWDLSNECLAAAKEGLAGRLNTSNLDVLVSGALSKGLTPAYDEIAQAALESETEAEEWWKDNKEEYRQAMQGELDADRSSFAAEEPQEHFYPSRVAFETLLRVRRNREGFAWISMDPLVEHFVRPWAEAVATEAERAERTRRKAATNDGAVNAPDESDSAAAAPTDASLAEWEALFKACNSNTDTFWRAVASANYRGAAQRVIDGMRTLPTGDLSTWAEAAVSVLDPAADIKKIENVIAAEPALSGARRLALAFWLRRRQTNGGDDGPSKVTALLEPLLDANGKDALDRCLHLMDESRRKTDEDGRQPSEPSVEVVGLLTEVATDVNHPLAGPALYVLLNTGNDVKALLPAFLASADDEQRRPVFAVAASYGPGPLRVLVEKAISDDPDHDCRLAAMRALARDATQREVGTIFGRVIDPSALVRRELAALVGERKWMDGISVLIQLVSDTRNFGSDLVRGSPDYAVARAAANALGKFENLAQETIGDMIKFVSKQTTRLDPVVHYAVVDALAFQDDSRLTKLFLKLLSSRIRMDGTDDDGFPVRYAAAWALVSQYHSASQRTADAADAIAIVANHMDARLAGPAIIALTMLDLPAHAALAKAISGSPYRQNAAVLALIVTRWVNATLSPAVDQIVPTDHPVRPLLDEVAKNTARASIDVAQVTKQWIAAAPAVAEWLASVADNKGFSPAIRFALGQLIQDSSEVFVKWGNYRDRDLARSVPLLTTWQMAGGR